MSEQQAEIQERARIDAAHAVLVSPRGRRARLHHSLTHDLIGPLAREIVRIRDQDVVSFDRAAWFV